ncbi:hypothetical protein D3C72_1476550 [compost metagenome]
MAQAGARQALHQQAEFGDQVAGQPPAILLHAAQAVADGYREAAVLGLLEAFGITLQVEAGLGQLGHAGRTPLAALQALPDLQHVPGLVDDALGEVVLEAVAARIFVLGHGPASIGGVSPGSDRMMAPCYHLVAGTPVPSVPLLPQAPGRNRQFATLRFTGPAHRLMVWPAATAPRPRFPYSAGLGHNHRCGSWSNLSVLIET